MSKPQLSSFPPHGGAYNCLLSHLCHWVPCASQQNRLLGERSSPQHYLGVKCKVFPGERSLGVKILGFAIRLCWGRDSPCPAQADTLENLFSWLSKQRCTLHVEFVPCHSAGTLPSLHVLTRCVLFGQGSACSACQLYTCNCSSHS